MPEPATICRIQSHELMRLSRDKTRQTTTAIFASDGVVGD
jgi:hypothetical protein